MAIEAKPAVLWNKGEAALHILRQEYGNDWANKVKVIFAGDDTTDEDAMKVFSLNQSTDQFENVFNLRFLFAGVEGCRHEFPGFIATRHQNTC